MKLPKLSRFHKLFFLLSLPAPALFAQMENHYILGSNGMESAVKMPGWSMTGIYSWYHANRINDQKGHKVPLENSKKHLDFQYLVDTISYFSPAQFLGGEYGFQVMIPYQTLSPETVMLEQRFPKSQNKYRLSDIYFEPFNLRWNWRQLSIFLAYGFVAPTGRYKLLSWKNSGLGDWGQMVSQATTFFFDPQRTFSFSYFANYEFHSKKKHLDFKAGDNFCLEWGIGKKVEDTYTFAVVGYYEKQIKHDKGKDVPVHFRHTKDEVYSIGPELDISLKNPRGTLTARYEWELKARSRTQGKTLTAVAAFNF